LPACWASFTACEGVVCRPLLRNFLFLPCGVAYRTNLPYAGSAPGYAADCASHQA
jgi:hypothetical protein